MTNEPELDNTKGNCNGFKARWEMFGDTTLSVDIFKNSDQSIAPQITRLQGADPKPDFVYLCSYNPGGIMAVRQLRAAGVEIPILSNGALDGSWWKESVPELSNFYYTVWSSMFGDNPWPGVEEFYAAYEERYGEPSIHALAVYGHAALTLWAKAANAAGTTDGPAVVAELEKLVNEPTLGGPTTYTSKVHYGSARPMVMIEVQNWQHRVMGSHATSILPKL